jgi:transcriptional repressor NrdR
VQCPNCLAADTRVVDSRPAEEGSAIRRRRECTQCSYRFTTFERVEEVRLLLRKRSGGLVPFDRSKVVAGMVSACKGRPVDTAEIHRIAADLELAFRAERGEITTEQVGRAVLDQLRGLDQVAYLRFASVYKGFDDPADFLAELRLLEGRGSELETTG